MQVKGTVAPWLMHEAIIISMRGGVVEDDRIFTIGAGAKETLNLTLRCQALIAPFFPVH